METFHHESRPHGHIIIIGFFCVSLSFHWFRLTSIGFYQPDSLGGGARGGVLLHIFSTTNGLIKRCTAGADFIENV